MSVSNGEPPTWNVLKKLYSKYLYNLSQKKEKEKEKESPTKYNMLSFEAHQTFVLWTRLTRYVKYHIILIVDYLMDICIWIIYNKLLFLYTKIVSNTIFIYFILFVRRQSLNNKEENTSAY